MGQHQVAFYCPGCKENHVISNAPGRWELTGTEESPTIRPSVLVRSGHYAGQSQEDCWCSYEERFGEKSPFKCMQCHSFITDGKIEYLGDCTHRFAGQIVKMEDIP